MCLKSAANTAFFLKNSDSVEINLSTELTIQTCQSLGIPHGYCNTHLNIPLVEFNTLNGIDNLYETLCYMPEIFPKIYKFQLLIAYQCN